MTALDLDGDETVGGFYNKIDFDAAGGSPRGEPSIASCRAPHSQMLINEAFARRTNCVGRGPRAIGRPKGPRNTGIGEVEFGLCRQRAA